MRRTMERECCFEARAMTAFVRCLTKWENVNVSYQLRSDWQLRTRTLELGRRTLVMGVVNITPDSFSDGGAFLDPEAAVAHGLKLLDEGADMLDLGAESTRPGSRAGSLDAPAVSAEEEQARLLPVLEGILRGAAGCGDFGGHIQGGDGAGGFAGGRGDCERCERVQVGCGDGGGLRGGWLRGGADAHARAAGGVAQRRLEAG